MRREYLLKIEINGRLLNRVMIDAHYEKKHAGVIMAMDEDGRASALEMIQAAKG